MATVVFEEGYPVTCERCGHEFYADIAKLERAVVETAKVWMEAGTRGSLANLLNTIDALNRFEVEHKVKEGVG